MGSYLLSQVKDKSLAIFLGFWVTLTNALFVFIGTELIGVCAIALLALVLIGKHDFR